MIWMLVEVPFCGPQTVWKSDPGSQEKLEGAFSPSMTNVTLNCSPTATRFGHSILILSCAYAAKATSAKHIVANSRLILKYLVISPILLFLAGLQGRRLLFVHLVLCLFLTGLDGLEHLLGLLGTYL